MAATMDRAMKVGIVMFGPAFIGGAEKRYSNFYSYVRNRGGDIRLLVNSSLYATLHGIGILDVAKDSNITVVEHAVERGYRSHFAAPPVEGSGNPTGRKNGFTGEILSAVKMHLLYLDVWFKVEKWRRMHGLQILHGIFQGCYALTPYFHVHTVPTVISYFDSSFTALEKKILKWFFGYRQGLLHADQVDFLSGFVYDGVCKRGFEFDPERVSVAPCSFIDYSHCGAAEKKQDVVVFCGRLVPYKNPLLFIEAIPRILRAHPDIRFCMLGKGPLENEVLSRIRAAGIQDRVQVGFNERPAEVLGSSCVFVSLQETNNYPSQSLLEAMACENAVIATDVGETGLLVDDSIGVRIPKSAEALARAVISMLDDKPRTLRRGKQARARVLSEQTVERFTDYMFSVYAAAHDVYYGRGGCRER